MESPERKKVRLPLYIATVLQISAEIWSFYKNATHPGEGNSVFYWSDCAS